MTWRGRDIRWVVPRSAEGTTAGRGADGACGAAGDDGAADGCAALTSSGASAWASSAGGSGCGAGCAARWARAASIMSCLRMRPPTPVPVTLSRSTACSTASLRTSGVTYGASPPGSGAGDGYSAAGASSVDDVDDVDEAAAAGWP